MHSRETVTFSHLALYFEKKSVWQRNCLRGKETKKASEILWVLENPLQRHQTK